MAYNRLVVQPSPPSPSLAHSRGASQAGIEHLREIWEDFWRSVKVVVPGFSFFGAVIIVATVGYIELGWPPFDALYMVVISVFSVGYGEIRPVDSTIERIWTMMVILMGWVCVVVTLGGITKAVTEGELRRVSETVRKLRAVEHLHDHVIICGYGRMGATLARELKSNGVPFIIIDRDEERIAQISVDGYLAVKGDATDEAVLEMVGIRRAKTLATVLPQDALNVYITLTSRNLSAEIKIISRGEQSSTEKKLRQAGADEVILPATIGALRIANSIIEPEISKVVRESAGSMDLHSMGIEIDELALLPKSSLVGKTVSQIGELCGGELMVLGVRREQEVIRESLKSVVLVEGDALVAISRNKQLPDVLTSSVKRIEIL